MSKIESVTEAPEKERSLKLSENLGALVGSVVFVIGGGLLAVSGWGRAAEIGGGVLALIGMITGNVTLWALVKSLWQGARP